MEALRDYLTRHEDPSTGRPLFQPHITRGPKATNSADAATASWVAVDDIDLLGESPAEMRGHVIQTSLGERQERSRGA